MMLLQFKPTRPWLQLGAIFLAVALALVILLPLAQLELRAFADGGAAFKRMLNLPRFDQTVTITVLLALGSSVLAVALGTVLAWCVTLLPRQVRTVGRIIPLIPLLIPAASAVMGWIFLLSPKVGYLNYLLRQTPLWSGLEEGPFDIYSVKWIILLTGLLLASFVYLFVHIGLANMGEEMEAAAAASGASPVRQFLTITLPLLRPSLIFSAGVVFLLGLGQFTVPLLLGRTARIDVITTQMFFITQTYPVDYGLGAALGFPILVVGLLVVVLQKVGLGEERRFVVVSARSRNFARRSSWLAALVVLGYGLVTALLPLLALIYVSVSPFWRNEISFADLTSRHFNSIFGNALFTNAIWTSVIASIIAVFIVTALGFFAASSLLSSSKVARPTKILLDTLVSLPVAIPASLLGFGLLFAYTGPPLPLYGTSAILVVTYVTLMIGYATRLQLTTLVGIGREFGEASSSSGAGVLRTLFHVTLPMARKGVLASVLLTFILMFHEFSASMMVRSARAQVIGGVMYDALTDGVYGQVAVLALVMVVVTIACASVALWLAGSDGIERL